MLSANERSIPLSLSSEPTPKFNTDNFITNDTYECSIVFALYTTILLILIHRTVVMTHNRTITLNKLSNTPTALTIVQITIMLLYQGVLLSDAMKDFSSDFMAVLNTVFTQLLCQCLECVLVTIAL